MRIASSKVQYGLKFNMDWSIPRQKYQMGSFLQFFFIKIGLFCSYLLYGSLFLLQRVTGLGAFHEKLTRDMA